MDANRFNNFGELYRAALAENDERKKTSLLREVERIIRAAQAEPAKPAVQAAKAA
jgi:hypothetical protein